MYTFGFIIGVFLVMILGTILGIIFGKKLAGPLIFAITAAIELVAMVGAQLGYNAGTHASPVSMMVYWIIYAVLFLVGIIGIVIRRSQKKAEKQNPKVKGNPYAYDQQNPNVNIAWGQPQNPSGYPSNQDIYNQPNVSMAWGQPQQPAGYQQNQDIYNQPMQAYNQPVRQEQPYMYNQPVMQEQPNLYDQPAMQEQSQMYSEPALQEEPQQEEKAFTDMNVADDEAEADDVMYMTSPVLNSGREIQEMNSNSNAPIRPAQIQVRWDDIYPVSNVRPLPQWEIAKAGIHVANGKFYRVDSRRINGRIEDYGTELSLEEFRALTNNRYPEITEQNSLSYLPRGKR